MILATLDQKTNACRPAEAVLKNKVLVTSVYLDNGQIIATADLFTLREIVEHPVNRTEKTLSVTEAVRRFWESRNDTAECDGREHAEAFLDQVSALARMEQLDERGNTTKDDAEQSVCHITSTIACSLYERLPESVDYAV